MRKKKEKKLVYVSFSSVWVVIVAYFFLCHDISAIFVVRAMQALRKRTVWVRGNLGQKKQNNISVKRILLF